MKISKGASKLRISPHSLYYWRNTGLLSPAESQKRGDLSFTDIVRARFICLCRRQGISLQALRQAAADHSDWQTKLSLYAQDSHQGHILVQREEEGLLLPVSRQLLLNFEKKPKKSQPVSLESRAKRGEEGSSTALIQKLENRYEEALEKQESPKEIERILKKMIGLDPEYLSAWVEIGNFYFSRGKMPKARQAYERSLEIDPFCIEALYNLGNLHFKDKRYGVCIRYFRKCLESDPKFHRSPL